MVSAKMERVDATEQIRRRYALFAEVDTRGRSPLYAEVAAAVAQDDEIVAFLATMPPLKRQPNLLFGAVVHLYGRKHDARAFVELIHAHRDEIGALMAERSTQTNEPARCATLMPLLARLPQPLALLEVGTSGGLCLLPDRYGYDYGRAAIAPPTPAAPVFTCRASTDTPLPARHVEVAWRAGLDLRPLDLGDDEEIAWLEALIWPGEEYRIPRLRAAVALARAEPPRVIRGDLVEDLPALAAEAPRDATLVVFHTAVLMYVTPEARETFARTVRGLDATWIANESPTLIPGVPREVVERRRLRDEFLITVDGAPAAWADGHATWIDWYRAG
jgi:hypothetical protein